MHGRRYNHTGCVRKLSGNRRRPYQVLSPEIYINGKKQRIKLGYFEKRKEADERLDKWNKEHHSTNFTINPDCSLSDLYNLWCENNPEGKRSKSTNESYSAAWKHMSAIKDTPLYSYALRIIKA